MSGSQRATSAFLHPYAPPAQRDFVRIVRGEGARVYDDTGKEYVDALASLWYCNIGHGRAEVADAVAAQMRTLENFHTFDRFTNEPAERVCATLASIAPMPGARVFLTTSGSEAVDSAIKLARVAHSRAGRPNRTVVVARQNAYHGVTYGGLSAQGLPANQEGYGPLLPDVTHVAHDDIGDAKQVFADRGDAIAAVITEPVQGAGGVHPPPDGYMSQLRDLCDEHGAYLIVDEVICGFGRLGGWWGSQRYGVEPDLVTFAKGVTSGYQPLGGVLVGAAVREPLEADESWILRHGHTYSGHACSCVAGETVIGITRDEDLAARAAAIGSRFAGHFDALSADGTIASYRGDHAIWAVVLADGVDATDVKVAMLERGVIARNLGPSVVAFCPPLVITPDEVDRCVQTLRDAVHASE